MNDENSDSYDSYLPGISIATAEIWKLFQTTIPLLFKDTFSLKDEKHIEKLGIIIEKCKEHSDIYVPPNGLSVEQYTKQLPHYKAFTTWLLGQLVRVLCKKELESYFQSSVDSQITILNFLAVNNAEMLIFVLREYFLTIQDLMKGRFELLESPTVVEYKFERFSYKPDYGHSQASDLLEQMPFCVNSASTCSEVLISILFVVEKQIKWLTYSSSNDLNFLWSLALKIVEDSDVSVVVAALDVLTTLIKHDGCTEIFLKFVRQLCTHLEPLVLYINMTFKGNCSDNKNIVHLLKALGGLLGVITKKKLSRPELLSCLFHIMLTVLHKDNPFLFTGCTVENVCRFISIMNKIFPQDANIKKRISPLLEELHKCPSVLYILEDIVFNEIRETCEKAERADKTVSNKNWRITGLTGKAIELSTTYRDCWNCLIKCMEQLQLFQKSILEISGFLKIFIEKIFILQHSLEKKLRCKNIMFLTSSFFDRFTELLITSKSDSAADSADHQKCITNIVCVCKYLLLMPDIGNTDRYVYRIIGFLSSPWLHMLPPPDFLLSDLDTYKQLSNYISIEDKRCCAEFRLNALAYCTNGKTNEWRLQILVSSLNSSLQYCIYEVIPLFVNSANHNHCVSVINQVLMPMDTDDFGTALKMTYVIPTIVCSILGKCKPVPQKLEPNLTRQRPNVDSPVEVHLSCTTCDGRESPQSQENQYKTYVNALIKKYMNLRLHMTPKVRQQFVLSLRRLSNHLEIFRTPSVFRQLLLLMDDGETQVRMALANTIVYLIFKMKLGEPGQSVAPISNNTESELLLEAFYQKTAQCMHSSLLLCSSDLQLSLISTVFNVGSMPLDIVLLPVMKLFTIYIAHPSALNAAAAQTQLSRVAALHHRTVQELFFRFQDELSKVVVTMFVYNYLSDEKSFHNSVFTLANGFGFATPKDFLERTVTEYLLKYLVPWIIKIPKTSRMLDLLAEYNNSDVATIIKNGFQYAYPHVLLFEDDAKLAAACDLFVSLSGINLRSLILLSIKMILCQLLLYYHRNTVRVKKALAEMKRWEFSLNNFSFSSDTDIADFIQPRFLGVLAFLDSKLVERTGCESVKKNVLLTLPDLIKLMGSVHITPVRFKVMATLRSALNLYHGFFPELICSAWRAFVQNVEPPSLGPMLSTIFVSLLPLMEQFPVEIGSVFHILIIQNLADVTPNLPEIHFLEDTPAVHEIYTLVQKSLVKVRELPIKEQLKLTLRSATHENADVRKHGLKKLREELSIHRKAIYELITGKDTMDPLMIEILDALITGCRDSDEEIQVACGECLGEIGAVDPGRLPNKVAINEEEKELIFQVDSDAFVKKALLELVRALQAATHTITMDNFALCIQELLKIFGMPSNKREVWESLSDSTKEIITPLLCSRYVYINDASSQPLPPHPVFGTVHGMTLKNWAFNWACRLIPMVTETLPQAVFSVCRLGLKKDTQTLLFFLPYILLYAILSASQKDRDLIAEEILTVLSWSEEKQNDRGDNSGRGILTSTVIQIQPTDTDEAMTHTLCVKTVYELFDFLYQWLRETNEKLGPKTKSSSPTQYDTVNEFLKRFSKLAVAEGSYACKDYTRALMYLEEYVSEHPEELQKYLPSFGKIYSALNDPDSFRGIIAIHNTEPTAKEMILYHEVTGQLHDAAACYECLSQQNMDNEEFHKAMIRCYLSMDQPSTALQLAEGFLNRWTERSTDLMSERAEAMWSMSMFNELEQYIKNDSDSIHDSSWGVSLGRALLHLSNGREKAMMQEVNKMQQNLVKALSTTSVAQCGYRLGYDSIVKLHILNEFQKLGKMVLKMFTIRGDDTEAQLKNMFTRLIVEELDERLKIIQPSCRVVQPVLCIRRVVLSLAQEILSQNSPTVSELFNREIGKSWLKSIEIARKACNFQQAYTNIMTAENYKPKGLFIEKAKLLWAKAEPEGALNTLKRGIEHHFPEAATFKSMPQDARREDRRLCAEAKLLIATYNDENVNVDMDLNLGNYKEALEVCKDWEKSIVCLAQYKYRYLRTIGDNNDSSSRNVDFQVYIINYFGKSLQYGCEYIYQSMPRMLSIWLDFGTRLAQDIKPGCNMANLSERRNALSKMITLIQTYVERLPTYMFMTAFSQIISRICHPHKDCFKVLKMIIAKIIVAYPQQALWMFISVYKSPYGVRVKRCEEVLRSSEILENSGLSRMINDFKELVDQLIELCHKPVKGRGGIKMSVRTFVPSLYRLVTNPNFSPILIPLQKYRTIALPTSMYSNHNPFPENMVFIAGMRDEVEILVSLQKPKKFNFIGTDGRLYPMMCKPTDDLRLDARMMEFNSIVNMYLQRDPESRDRGLRIRTYSVVPLNDDSGLVEWLPNLYRMRIIIMKIYKVMGIDMQSKELKDICSFARNDPLSKKRQIFLEVLLPRHPPVLKEWFLKEFPHPTAWYLARTAYVRTTAVMSIVGSTLGLGDRHGENILLDSTCGDVVHVDFNCLFNKGERFDWPERVPFRLTHNMVSAMGPTGVEGMFRHSCEITNRVMRQQIDQLMSVVRPFLYDPLVTRNSEKNIRDENAEMTNEKAMEDIQNIELRLQGIVRTRNKSRSIPLSVEGQVDSLIQEATNVDNLCQMYFGWGPFL